MKAPIFKYSFKIKYFGISKLDPVSKLRIFLNIMGVTEMTALLKIYQ